MNIGINLSRMAAFLDQLGATIPAEIADVAETRRAIGDLMVTPPTLAFEQDLAAGNITSANAAERIMAAATAKTAHDNAIQIARNADPILDKLERRALVQHGDRIIEAMRPAFDQAAAALATFVDVFGTHPDPKDVLAARADGSELWQAHTNAVALLDDVRRICSMLAVANYFAEPDCSWFIAAADNSERLSQARAAASRGFDDLAAEGFTLRLNTADEARTVVANSNQRERRDLAELEAAATAEHTAEVERIKRQALEMNHPAPWEPTPDPEHPGTTATKTKRSR